MGPLAFGLISVSAWESAESVTVMDVAGAVTVTLNGEASVVVSGAVRFATAAVTAGLKGIIGVELTIDMKEKEPSHIVLLAENREGYGNLSTLITRARLDHPRGIPRVTLATLDLGGLERERPLGRE